MATASRAETKSSAHPSHSTWAGNRPTWLLVGRRLRADGQRTDTWDKASWADILRRAPYFRQLGLSPAWAKEVRVFGLVDWKTADAGHPGVDPVNLHVKMATQHGPAAPAHVLDGWERERGRAATDVP
jgi:hypothetical protein